MSRQWWGGQLRQTGGFPVTRNDANLPEISIARSKTEEEEVTAGELEADVDLRSWVQRGQTSIDVGSAIFGFLETEVGARSRTCTFNIFRADKQSVHVHGARDHGPRDAH